MKPANPEGIVPSDVAKLASDAEGLLEHLVAFDTTSRRSNLVSPLLLP